MREQIPLPRPEIRQSPALGWRCIAEENRNWPQSRPGDRSYENREAEAEFRVT